MIPKMAFEHLLAVRVSRKHKDGVTVECALRDDLLNSQGVAHGGVIASFVDEAAWFAIEELVGKGRETTTTELKVNYLRPVTGKKIVGRAYLLKAGKTLCVSRVDVMDQQRKLAAVAIVTYILLGERR